jgi:hypothetical protein
MFGRRAKLIRITSVRINGVLLYFIFNVSVKEKCSVNIDVFSSWWQPQILTALSAYCSLKHLILLAHTAFLTTFKSSFMANK